MQEHVPADSENREPIGAAFRERYFGGLNRGTELLTRCTVNVYLPPQTLMEDYATTIANLGSLFASTYFDGLAEYGVERPLLGTVFYTNPACPPLPSLLSPADVGTAIARVSADGLGLPPPGRSVLHLFVLTPDILLDPSFPEFQMRANDPFGGGGGPPPGAPFTGRALHNNIVLSLPPGPGLPGGPPAPVAYALVLRNPDTQGNLPDAGAIIQNAAHEIVEGITNPFQHGLWVVNGYNNDNDELCDWCAFVQTGDAIYELDGLPLPRYWAHGACGPPFPLSTNVQLPPPRDLP
jgi:hypothetical protein